MILKHYRAVWARFVDFSSLQNNAAFGGIIKTRDNVEHGGFSTARVSNQRDEFTFGDRQIDVLQRPKRFTASSELNTYLTNF